MIKRLFGQYVNKDSVMHKLDPRIKIICMIAISILLFSAKSYYMIIMLTAIILTLLLLSKLELSYLINSMKPFAAIIILIILMYFVFSGNKMNEGFISIWRFLMLIASSLILTSTTTIKEIISSTEYLLKPLNSLKGIRTRNTALLLSITIRFIPLFFAYASRVNDALAARGARLNKARHIRLFTLKILDRMFRSASTLSDAIESRCYDWGYKK